MGRRRVEKMIIPALDAIEGNMFGDEKDCSKWSIPSEFKGYISSFGASTIQNGLVPTLYFFSNKNANTREDRSIIIKLLFELLKKYYNEDNTYSFDFENTNDLLELVKKNSNQTSALTEIIMDAAIALKLAMRTYKIVDKKE